METEKKEKSWKSQYWRKTEQIDWDSYTDADLLAYYEKSKDIPEIEVTDTATGENIRVKGTAAFQEYLQTPFDYSQLCYELEKKRGAKKGYYFEKDAATVPAELESTEHTVIDFTAKRSITGKVQVAVTKETEEALAVLKEELKRVGLDGKQAWGVFNGEIYARAVAEALAERQAGRLFFEKEERVSAVERKRL